MKDIFGILFNLFAIGSFTYVLLLAYGKINIPVKANKEKFEKKRVFFIISGWFVISVSLIQLIVKLISLM